MLRSGPLSERSKSRPLSDRSSGIRRELVPRQDSRRPSWPGRRTSVLVGHQRPPTFHSAEVGKAEGHLENGRSWVSSVGRSQPAGGGHKWNKREAELNERSNTATGSGTDGSFQQCPVWNLFLSQCSKNLTPSGGTKTKSRGCFSFFYKCLKKVRGSQLNGK